MSKVFIAGATGFIGKRLVSILLKEGHTVYALCRIQGTKVVSFHHDNLHIVYADLETLEKIEGLPNEIDVAYYLVHSMAKKIKDLKEKEGMVAQNFVSIMDQKKCKQIIYLGGIIDLNKKLSEHLQSRKMVEEILKKGSAPLTVFRSSIIIGSGSASFEIIRDLVEKLPIMIAPSWVNTYCQPIAIADVLFYLKSALLNSSILEKHWISEDLMCAHLKRCSFAMPVLENSSAGLSISLFFHQNYLATGWYS